MSRTKVHDNVNERMRAYRKRDAKRRSRYPFALKLLTKAIEPCLSQAVAPGLAAEINKFLEAEP